ncbi:hypothetical protein C1H46_030209 [Malus baccata]|uniref:Uncharacterized protein n=1 Tax=Malus baccata TaxID=106549 RepID=A0A540LCN6_MALBA|nr:hypothetical protein C1H46_030209 [Malus baccata]
MTPSPLRPLKQHVERNSTRFSISDGPSSFPDDLNWRIGIDLRTGNLQVLRLCRYYHNPMAVGRDKVVICAGRPSPHPL